MHPSAAASPSSQSAPRPWRPSAAASGSISPSASPSPSPQPYSPASSATPAFSPSASPSPSQLDEDEEPVSQSASTSRSRSRSRARSGRDSESDDESGSRPRSQQQAPAGRTAHHPMQAARAKVQQRRAEQRAAVAGATSCQCVTPSNLGCVERVLHLLYAAPPAGGAEAADATAAAAAAAPPPSSSPFRCHIPDSIVFSPHGSTAWYHTDTRTGTLQRRPDSCLNLEDVLAVFAPGVFDAAVPAVPPGLEGVAAAMLATHGERSLGAEGLSPLDPASTQIFAQFIYSSSYSPSALAAPATEDEVEDGSSHASGGGYIVYLTALELLRLLRDINPDLMAPRVFGILQRFHRPAEDAGRTPSQRRHPRFATATASAAAKQTVYKLLWTPHYFAAECRVNSGSHVAAPKPDGGNSSSNVFERLCTFDGPAHCSTLSHLSTPSSRRSLLEHLCVSVVARLHQHLPMLRVKYMELFVRLVPGISGGKGNEKAVLQYVRSMRVTDLRSATETNQASQHTLCMQCERSVDFRLSRSLAPAPEASQVAPTTTFVGRSSKLFDFGLRSNGESQVEEEQKEQPHQEHDQRLVLAASQQSQSMLRPYHPPHLRSHPTSFHSVLTPYELSAALGFQLLAPSLPAEALQSMQRAGGFAPSGRPQIVADVRGDSPARKRRGHSLVDTYPNARPQSAGPPMQPALAKYKQDVMGLYTRDLSAARRKQLLVALRASLPQASSTSFRRGGPAPSISTCHRFLDVPQPSSSRAGSVAASRSTSRPASAAPPSADLSREKSASASQRAAPPASAQRKPPPSHVWSSALHASFRQKPMLPAYMQQHQPRPKSSNSRPSSSPRLTLVQRQQQHALVARPSTSQSNRSPAPPSSRPRTATPNLYQLDPQAEYLNPTPSPEHYLLNPFDELSSSPELSSTEPAAESMFEDPSSVVAAVRARPVPAAGVPRARFPSAPSSKPSPYSSSGRARGQKVARVVPVRVSFERYFAEQMKHAKGDMQAAFGPRDEEADERDLAEDAAPDAVGEDDDAFDHASAPLQAEAPSSSSGRASTRASTVGSPLSPRSRRMSQDGGGVDSRAAKEALLQSASISTPPPPPVAPSRPRSYADVESSRIGVLPPSKVQQLQQQQQASPYSSGGGRKSGVSFAGHISKPGSKRGSARASGVMMQVQLSTAAKAAAAAAATASVAPVRSAASPLPPRPVASSAAAPIRTAPSQPSSHSVASISDDDDDGDGAYEDDADFAALESEAAATHALHSSSRPTSSKVTGSAASAGQPDAPPAEDLEVELEYNDDEEGEERYIDDAEAAATLAAHSAQQWSLTPVAHDSESVIAEEDPEAEYAEEWS